MNDNDFFNLGKDARGHIDKAIRDDWVPAVTGIERGAGVYSLRGDTAHNDKLPTNQVYVRTAPGINNGTPFAVSNTAVGLQANLDVFIRKMRDGHWEIVGVNSPNATLTFGEKAMTLGAPPATGEAPNLTPGRDFYPGRVIIWTAGTLKVNLSEPYPYVASDGTRAVWTPTDANTLDIVSNVPGSAQQRWVQLALNPAVTTPALVAFSGTAQSLALPLAPDGFKSIAVTSGYIVLDAVRLVTGDVDETTVTENRWKYARVAPKKGVQSIVAGTNITVDNTDPFNPIVTASGGGGAALDLIILRDEKAVTTGGGVFTSGAWRTRTLNVEASDAGNHCTLASNQFTLDAGTYRITASAGAFLVNAHQIRLQNVTDATTTIVGTTEVAGSSDSVGSRSIVEGRFTIAGAKAFEIQHQCQTTRAFADGMGYPAGFTTEVYAIVKLEKE